MLARMAASTLPERLLFPTARVDTAALRQALSGRTTLVTDASFGIGEQVARLAGAAGARVLLVARTMSRLEAIAADIAATGGTALALSCDLNDADAVERLAGALPGLSTYIVVSNEGKSIRRLILQSLDRFHDVTRTANINFLLPCRLMLAAIPGLIERGGQIVNVSALNVLLQPTPNWAAYQASKTAFDQWLRSAVPELRARHRGAVGVSAACAHAHERADAIL